MRQVVLPGVDGQREMVYLIGIDGGGSRVRVAITDADLHVLSEAEGSTANPSVVGRAAAAQVIQETMRTALVQVGFAAEQIGAVGIGIAGASATYAGDWLREVVQAVTPDALLVLSSDVEIALVGAHGARRGVLVLAGTGSVALGMDGTGRVARAGGWGYLLGDEGSGYWIGMEGLRAVMRAADGRGAQTVLERHLLDALEVSGVQAVTLWLYQPGISRTREIARLAPLVCQAALDGDRVAQGIVDRAAEELALLCRAVLATLNAGELPIAFAGGLLANPTPVRDRLCSLLGMNEPPHALYPPVVGAALLARLGLEEGRRDSSGGL